MNNKILLGLMGLGIIISLIFSISAYRSIPISVLGGTTRASTTIANQFTVTGDTVLAGVTTTALTNTGTLTQSGVSTISASSTFTAILTSECTILYTSSTPVTSYYVYVNAASSTTGGSFQLLATSTKPGNCP